MMYLKHLQEIEVQYCKCYVFIAFYKIYRYIGKAKYTSVELTASIAVSVVGTILVQWYLNHLIKHLTIFIHYLVKKHLYIN